MKGSMQRDKLCKETFAFVLNNCYYHMLICAFIGTIILNFKLKKSTGFLFYFLTTKSFPVTFHLIIYKIYIYFFFSVKESIQIWFSLRILSQKLKFYILVYVQDNHLHAWDRFPLLFPQTLHETSPISLNIKFWHHWRGGGSQFA